MILILSLFSFNFYLGCPKIIMILISHVKWLMSEYIFLVDLFGSLLYTILILLKSGSNNLLIILLTWIIIYLIKLFRRHHFMNWILSIFLLWQKILDNLVTDEIHVQWETISTRISHIRVANHHAVLSPNWVCDSTSIDFS